MVNVAVLHRYINIYVLELEFYISQECDIFPLPEVQQLVSSVLTCLQTVIETRGDANLGPVSTFFRWVTNIFHKIVNYLTFNICYVFYILL